jgi:hypothetical protein
MLSPFLSQNFNSFISTISYDMIGYVLSFGVAKST